MKLVMAPRQSGKTQALMTIAAANPEAVVVTASAAEAHRLMRQYDMKPGQVIAADRLVHRGGAYGMGHGRTWLLDDVDRMPHSREITHALAGRGRVIGTA